jgi:uncharacterized protein YndB with AHSA1/START domain
MNRDEIEAGGGGVVLEREYPHPPERVWEALTDPKALSDWLLPTTTRPVLGGCMKFIDRAPGGRSRKVQCRVVELDAPRRLAYSWKTDDEAAPSLVCWTLEPVDGGTHVRLEHVLPEGGSLTLKAYAGGRFGASSALARLGRWLAGGGAFSGVRRFQLYGSNVSCKSYLTDPTDRTDPTKDSRDIVQTCRRIAACR